MAEINKPEYTNKRKQVYNVRPERSAVGQQIDVPDTMFSVANVFDTLAKSLVQYDEHIKKSEIRSNRSDATDLIKAKTKHHQDLKVALNTHLKNTPNLRLTNVINDIKDKQLMIGQERNISINPMELDESLPDGVKELVEETFIRLDGNLLETLVKGVNDVQSQRDLEYLSQGEQLFKTDLRKLYTSTQPVGEANEQAKILIKKEFEKIETMNREGGSIGIYQAEMHKEARIQSALKEWFDKDRYDPSKDISEVIRNADRKVYRIKINDKWHYLDPSYYEQDRRSMFTNARSENERKKKELLIDTADLAFHSYQDKYSGEKFPGFAEAQEALLSIPNLSKKKIINWLFQQRAENKQRELNDLEKKILADFEYDSQGTINSLTIEYGAKNKDGIRRRKPKTGKSLVDAISYKYSNYNEEAISSISKGFINDLTRLHYGKEKNEYTKEEIEKENAYLSHMEITAGQALGSGEFLKRFFIIDDKGEWMLSRDKVEFDEGLIEVFGQGRVNEKFNKIQSIAKLAINTNERFHKTQQGKLVNDKFIADLILNIQNEYSANAQNGYLEAHSENPKGQGTAPRFDWVSLRTDTSDRNLNKDQLAEMHKWELQFKNILRIGANIKNRNLSELGGDISYIDKSFKDHPYNTRLKEIVKKHIGNRIKNLKERSSELALIETNQQKAFENGEKIDVQKIKEWRQKYGIQDYGKLMPENLLNQVGQLIDLNIKTDKRLDTFTFLYNRTKLFGNRDSQRLALLELRSAIKGGGMTGNKTSTPALAGLLDLWGDLEASSDKMELFEIATTKITDPDNIKPKENFFKWQNKVKNVKEAIRMKHVDHGIKSTLQSPEQRSDLGALEEAVLNGLSTEKYFDDQSASEIADIIHKRLYGQYFVVKTGRRYNFSVPKNIYKENGLIDNIEEYTKSGMAHVFSQMEQDGIKWTLKPDLQSDLNMDDLVTQEVGDKNVIQQVSELILPDDVQKEIRKRTTLDIIKGESKNLRKGLINVDGGYQVGVYWLQDGNEKRSILVGTFHQKDENGNNVPYFISEEKFLGMSASKPLLRFLMNPKHFTSKLHQHIEDIHERGLEATLDRIIPDKVPKIPILRFLFPVGKLELNYAVKPLINKMRKRATELGLKEGEYLSYEEARKVLHEVAGDQQRWFEGKGLPDSAEYFLNRASDTLMIPY